MDGCKPLLPPPLPSPGLVHSCVEWLDPRQIADASEHFFRMLSTLGSLSTCLLPGVQQSPARKVLSVFYQLQLVIETHTYVVGVGGLMGGHAKTAWQVPFTGAAFL